MRRLVGLLRQRLVVVLAGDFGVEAEVERVFPAELERALRCRPRRRGAAQEAFCGEVFVQVGPMQGVAAA